MDIIEKLSIFSEGRQHADYVYSNKDDTIRVKIFQRESGEWDYDVFEKSKGGFSYTFSTEAGDIFRTKKEALDDAKREFGIMKLNNKLKNLGW